MYTEGSTTGLSVTGERPLTEQDRLRLGLEWRAQRLDDWWTPSGAMMWPGTFWNIRDGERDRYALFGEWEGRRGAWTHILGLRHETVKMDAGPVQGYKTVITTPPMPGTDVGNQIAESIAFNNSDRAKTDHNWDLAWLARVTPAAGERYELGLSRKTRSPSLYERYTWSSWQMAALMNNFVGDGNGYVGDVNLKPEVAYTLSLAGDWSGAEEAWGVRVSPYYSRVEDFIDAKCLTNCTNPNTFRVLRYTNVDAELYGLEVSAHTRLAAPQAWGQLGLKGSVSYTRGKNLDAKDGLYNIKPLTTKLSLTQRKGPWSGEIETEYVASKDKRSSVRNEMRTPAYGLVHLRASYAWPKVRLDFGVENLFDRLYYPPLGGAYVGQGTTMTIPPAPNEPRWGTPVPGPGRNFYAGLNVSF
jgi:iron complex outermembrane receptor protein